MTDEIPEALRSVSCTRFDCGQKCGYQFFRRYVLGERKPPTGALVFGRSDDEAKNTVYDHKIETGTTLDIPECQEIFAANFEEKSGDVEDWGDDKPAELKDLGVTLIGHWRETCAWSTNPVMTQKRFGLPINYRTSGGDAKSFTFEGVLDLVEDVTSVGRVITDNKTSKRKWSKKNVADSTQALFYGVAAEREEELVELGVDPDQFHFHVAVKSKVPQLQAPATDPAMVRHTDAAERQGAIKRMALFHQQVEANMANDSFLPNRSHFMCSRKWCGWWSDCEKAFGGKVKE